MITKFRFSLLCGVLLCLVSCKQEHSESTPLPNLETVEHSIFSSILSTKIDSLFESEFKKGTFIGAGISIVIDKKVAYEKTMGYENFKTKKRLDNNSIFRIGSLSKSFTGVLSGILHQGGLIDFDGKIQDKIPNFRLQQKSYAKDLKLSHILSHTGGFPYHSYTNLVEDGLSMQKITPYFKQIKETQKPGTLYSYQNAAFALSGEYMAKATGISVRDLFMQKMFQPIGMQSSSVDYKSIKNAKNIALPHQSTAKGWKVRRLNKKYYNAIPAGGVNTTTSDMSKFLKLLLEDKPELLSSKQIDIITEPQIRTKVSYKYYKKWPNFNDSYYALGWRVHTLNVPNSSKIDTLVHHGGMVNGYRSEMAFHKKEKFAICVMFNSTSPFSRRVIPEIVQLIRATKTGKANNLSLEE